MNPIKRAVERPTPALNKSNIKATQCSKIRELRQTLVKAGHLTLDQQAESLGLARSTAWAILRGNHKHSGLSAATIKRMLSLAATSPARQKDTSGVRRGEIGGRLWAQPNAASQIS